MKRIILPLVLAFGLGGCAVLDVGRIVSGASVPAQQIALAVTLYNTTEVGVAQYVRLPRCGRPTSPVICSSYTAVVQLRQAVRAGRSPRNEAIAFLKANPQATLGPSGVYSAVNAATQSIKGICAQYNDCRSQ